MAATPTLSVISPKLITTPTRRRRLETTTTSSEINTCRFLTSRGINHHQASCFGSNVAAGRRRIINKGCGRLKGSFNEIEPDLNEDPIDIYRTPGVDPEDFEYGIYDGHHTYFEGEDEPEGSYWELILKDIQDVGAPTGFQGIISWLFLPVVATAMYFDAPKEYLFIGAGLFAFVFTIIEMDKPDQPHNFEPQIYTMERGARDKLINDYNTMSIWDFNEKYGDLWDFTVTKDEIAKR